MLDIKYLKQVDEVLEMSERRFYPQIDGGLNYIPDGEENSVYAVYIKNGVMTGGLAIYKLYLQEVIEAINKAEYEGETNHYYTIKQYRNGVKVFYIADPVEWFCLSEGYTFDEMKEKAIIYIMDHIKEKV